MGWTTLYIQEEITKDEWRTTGGGRGEEEEERELPQPCWLTYPFFFLRCHRNLMATFC